VSDSAVCACGGSRAAATVDAGAWGGGSVGTSCVVHLVGDRDAPLAASVRADLARRSVVLESSARGARAARLTPVLCVSADPDDTLAEVVTGLAVGGRRVLVIAGAGGCSDRIVWKALSCGACDVVSWVADTDPGAAVLARLDRWAQVDARVGSSLVRDRLVGRSVVWTTTLRRVVEVARFTGTSLLVTGESGTGKELVARLFHHLDTRPDKRDLIVVDCTTVVPTLSGSEFFGHERGAFTGAVSARDGAFAAADRGTLFLDEVGELPLPMQAELLRVIQEGTYKRVGGDTWRSTTFRLVCATNRDLPAEVAAGRFRLDLYHRLAASTVALPPLRDRPGDVLELFGHFLAEATGVVDVPLDPAVAVLLERRDYPGNVRDLRHLALRIAARHVGPGPITPGDVPDEDRPSDPAAAGDRAALGLLESAVQASLEAGRGYREIRDAAADAAVRVTVRQCGDDLQEAAKRLGVTDRMLQKWRADARASARPFAMAPTPGS
jgi:DNA-binding NtrC family response regulator